jgi:hypothetical protein
MTPQEAYQLTETEYAAFVAYANRELQAAKRASRRRG